MKIGCHVSIAGGLENAPKNARDLDCECFQMFSRSPRGGNYTPLDEKGAKTFLEACKKYKYEIGKDYVIHSPYFINLASSNNRIYYGSINILRQELDTASLIDCPYVITHIGSAKDISGKTSDVSKDVGRLILRAIKKIHEKYSGSAQLVLEIAAGSGQIIGDSLEEIGYFLKQAKKDDIELGFCFDTCHSFAAGYDLRSAEKVREVFAEIDKVIGLDHLKCIHFNDSMTEFDSHKDRHEHIGKGQIGKENLKEVVKVAQELDLNLYLETKHDKIEEDLKVTKGFRDNSR